MAVFAFSFTEYSVVPSIDRQALGFTLIPDFNHRRPPQDLNFPTIGHTNDMVMCFVSHSCCVRFSFGAYVDNQIFARIFAARDLIGDNSNSPHGRDANVKEK
jgi:hypothetical protein